MSAQPVSGWNVPTESGIPNPASWQPEPKFCTVPTCGKRLRMSNESGLCEVCAHKAWEAHVAKLQCDSVIAARIKGNNAQLAPGDRYCPICHSEVLGGIRKIYCSDDCRETNDSRESAKRYAAKKAARVVHVCQACSKSFLGEGNRTLCSAECRRVRHAELRSVREKLTRKTNAAIARKGTSGDSAVPMGVEGATGAAAGQGSGKDDGLRDSGGERNDG